MDADSSDATDADAGWLARLRGRCSLYAAWGPRHLCRHRCFYREFAPAREALRVRERLAAAGVDAR